MCSEVIYLK